MLTWANIKLYFNCYQFCITGLWIVNVNRHSSHAVSSQWNGSRLHVRHPQTPTHDHFWRWQSSHTDLSQLAWPTSVLRAVLRSAHVSLRLRRDRADLQCHHRRGRCGCRRSRRTTKSKANDVQQPSLPIIFTRGRDPRFLTWGRGRTTDLNVDGRPLPLQPARSQSQSTSSRGSVYDVEWPRPFQLLQSLPP